MTLSIESLGIAPDPDTVHGFFKSLGYDDSTIGFSLKRRPITMYSRPQSGPTVLFLSLTHGNEPMGLMSLLYTAEILSESRRNISAIFVPILNIDAYLYNRPVYGCRRTNMRSLCNQTEDRVAPGIGCTIEQDGVDLNRNYPEHWQHSSPHQTCSSNYPGRTPFSEPETQAIRDFVASKSLHAAMTFHSMSHVGRPDLLIHPFSSKRPISEMDPSRLQLYREFSRWLKKDTYIAGTAMEAIQYAASGTTIDWLDSQGIISFVLEATPPCDSRWCPKQSKDVHRRCRVHGKTAVRFAELAVGVEKQHFVGVIEGNHYGIVTGNHNIVGTTIVVSLLVFLLMTGRRWLVRLTRRFLSKEKLDQMNERELQTLPIEGV